MSDNLAQSGSVVRTIHFPDPSPATMAQVFGRRADGTAAAMMRAPSSRSSPPAAVLHSDSEDDEIGVPFLINPITAVRAPSPRVRPLRVPCQPFTPKLSARVVHRESSAV